MNTSHPSSKVMYIVGAIALVGVIANLNTKSVFADVSGGLLPVSNGSYTQWTRSPVNSSDHFTAVDDSACNGNSDYVKTTVTGQRESFGIDLTSIPNGAVITAISIQPCASRDKSGSGASSLSVFYRWDGADSADLGNYALTGTTPTTLTATAFTGLTMNKDALSALEIGAVYSSGNRGVRLSRLATTLTYTIPPIAPTNLTATASVNTTSSNVLLNWIQTSTNEIGFNVERSIDNNNFIQIATTGINSTSYLNTNVATGTYYYRVRAYNSAGSSIYTNTASTTVR